MEELASGSVILTPRRYWTIEEKRQIVEEAQTPGISVAALARQRGINANQLFHWRKLYRAGQLGGEAQSDDKHVLLCVHCVIGQLKRWLMGTHQGAVSAEHLDGYLNEFAFHFNRRTSAARGKLFHRLAQQAVQIEPVPFAKLVKPQKGAVASSE
jgi:transposase-like protein